LAALTAAVGELGATLYSGWVIHLAVLTAAAVPAVVLLAARQLRFVRAAWVAVAVSLWTAAAVSWALLSRPARDVAADAAAGLLSGVATTTQGPHPARATLVLATWLPVATLLVTIVVLIIRRRYGPGVAPVAAGLLFLCAIQFLRPLQGASAVAVAGLLVALVASVLLARPRYGARRRGGGASTGALTVLVLSVVASAAAAGAPHRRDPVEYERELPVPLVVIPNPLDVIAQRLRSPATVVFENSATVRVDRWRIAVLDRFDGVGWSYGARFVPLRGVLADELGDAGSRKDARALVAIPQATSPQPGPDLHGWLPSPHRPRSVEASVPVLVEPTTGTLREPVGGIGGYVVTWAQQPPVDDLLDRALFAGPRAAPPPVLDPRVSEIAREVVGSAGSSVAGALAIEAFLREGFTLDTSGKVAGHGPAQILSFLTRSRKGSYEQFAVAYANLALAVGIPVRVVVGFRQPVKPDADGVFRVRNRDVFAWPEIHVSGAGWHPLDPTPQKGARVSGTPSPTASPSASHPVVQPSVTLTVTPSPTPTPTSTRRCCTKPPLRVPWARLLLVAGPSTAIVLPLVPPTAKLLRRRRRRRRGGRAAVIGAWHELADRLLDSGHPLDDSATPREAADDIARDVPDAAPSMLLLAERADEALWSLRQQSAAAVDEAWDHAARVHRLVAGTQRLPRRVRGALSTRSLRRRR
jgi:transglutaminase-like putative cysteine protease